MKLIASALLSATLLGATQACAETWVQYDIVGSGSYDSLDVSTDPFTWESGHASFSGTFFVEIDPTNDDGSLSYYSDGKSFFQTDWSAPPSFGASAGNGTLTFGYSLIDGDCGHNFCEDIEVALRFAPGSFDRFPSTLRHFSGGDITLSESQHWWSLDARGSVWSASAKIVDAPGQSGFDFSTTPIALPEPASWATMLGGFGFIGGAMRSRRKAAVTFG